MKELQEKLKLLSAAIIIMALSIVSLALVVYSLHTPQQEDTKTESETPSNEESTLPTEKPSSSSSEEPTPSLDDIVEAGMIRITINPKPVFETGRSSGNIGILNHESNHDPQIVEIKLDETDEIIFKSDVLEIGESIDEIELDTSLGKGEYKCTALFTAVDAETGDLKGSAGAKVTLIIEND